ncbi:MAG: DNA-nicking Smr family endonuclease [Planctomycetota bacterium]|jgi:DNA-nicking Smr family endonuclease
MSTPEQPNRRNRRGDRGKQPPPADSSVDLHGLRPEDAQRRLERELHSARVRGHSTLLVITGRGLGNERLEPVLRQRISVWLRGPEGRARGVKDVVVEAKGGALRVRLG